MDGIMTPNELTQKINEVKTMPELDALRGDVVSMIKLGKEAFEKNQTAFRKAKNRLVRIPLRDRNW